jgi:hypothetical protein
MDIKNLFRGISKKLAIDFESYSEITHNGSKGTARENCLKEFLIKGNRLPKRYSVGSGEIIGPQGLSSRQSDLIIYDGLQGIPLIFDEITQVYPIDCIYGIIEVKSALSKEKLLEGLEVIKSVKELTPIDSIVRKGPGAITSYRRPFPFGIVFAYSLAGNSLDSLTNNLKEWEKENDPKYWPNLIIILNEGIIYHTDNMFHNHFVNEEINYDSIPIWLAHGKDSLFQFYSILLDLCYNTHLAPVRMTAYFELPEKIGPYFVKNHDRFVNFKKDGKVDTTKVYKLTEQFIHRIVTWCCENGKISNRELLLKLFGEIPHGLDDSMLNQKVYFYNPDNLPGMREVDNPFIVDETGRPRVTQRMAIPYSDVIVNGEVYVYPHAYFKEGDQEVIKGKTYEDII